MPLTPEQITHDQHTADLVAQTAVATAKVVFDAAQATAKLAAAENVSLVTAIALLQADVAMLKNTVSEWGKVFEKISSKLEEIALGRPSWAVSIILGAMSSTIVGLIVFVASRTLGR